MDAYSVIVAAGGPNVFTYFSQSNHRKRAGKQLAEQRLRLGGNAWKVLGIETFAAV